MTDFRALCAELVAALCKYDLDTEEEVALLDQARAALAEPVKERLSVKDILRFAEDLDVLKGCANDDYSKWSYSEDYTGYRDYREVDATNEVLALARFASTTLPTDEEWDALVERVWDQYETIGYQGERIMHCSDYGNALDIIRKEIARYSRGENNV